jgi:hypothetical protein
MTRTVFLFALLLVLQSSCFSQCYVTYTDVNNQVYLFDGSESHYIEPLPLLSQKIGRAGIIAYIAPNGRLKVYTQGKSFTITDNTPNYYMTDNWFLYQNFNIIKVDYKNEMKTLEMQFDPGADSLYYSDSLIVWQNALGELNAFHDGQIDMLDRSNFGTGKIGPNIFAYTDISGNFKVFYHGQTEVLESYVPSHFTVNQDMLLYADNYNSMKIFHDGILDETSTPMPTEYRVGKDFIAYISNLRQLVVYYKGQEQVLMDDHPLKWSVYKNMLVYTDKGNYFWCWYNGQNTLLERFIPENYKLDNDIVVYQDLDGRLKGFYYGQQVDISDQIVTNGYKLYNEAVSYQLAPYETTIWCNKKTYTFK